MSGLRANRASLSPVRHEDGTVRFWDASGVSLKPLYKLGTANIFQTDCEHNDSLNQAGEEEWPPFRKVRSPEPGWGDVAEDPPSTPLPPSALEGQTQRRAWRMHPSEPSQLCPGDVSPSSAQLPCDAPWGHKRRLFRVSHLVGLPRRGGRAGGCVGTDFSRA